MPQTKTLIEQIKDAGELQPIRESRLRSYQTCVRQENIGFPDSKAPGQWSCVKGWFETHGSTFGPNRIDFKVIDSCKFRNSEGILKKELGEFTVFTPKTSSDQSHA